MPNRFQRVGELSTTMALNEGRGPTGTGVMTVPIVGIPRGGTTLVAAVVDALGIFLGPIEELTEYHFEDQTMHSPDLKTQYECVRKRNAQYRTWGWKDPTGIASVQNIVFALRNPHVIVVFRDTLATLQGEMRFDKAYEVDPPRTFEQLIDYALRWRDANLQFILRTQFPTLLVSYERALVNPQLFLIELERFLELKPTAEQKIEALARISATGGYLMTDPEWRRDQGR